jgi:hypothetical protein
MVSINTEEVYNLFDKASRNKTKLNDSRKLQPSLYSLVEIPAKRGHRVLIKPFLILRLLHVRGRHGACCRLYRRYPAKFSVLFTLHLRRDDVSNKKKCSLVLTIQRKMCKMGRNKILMHNSLEDFFTTPPQPQCAS